ncbi:MAG: hypothetical protein ABR962_10515 [Candidatus Bathyarchaeia archaeon]
MTENSIDKELEGRVKKFLGYERKLHFFANYLSWFVIPVSIPLVILSLLGYSGTQVLPVIIITSSIWLLCAYLERKRAMTYVVQDNEWAIFYCHLIHESLEKRSKARTNELKREYQKEAAKYAEDFLSCINKRWTIGMFKLVRDSYAYPLNQLKKDLQYRIISKLKDGNEEELGKIEQVIYNFLQMSRNLKLEDIVSINTQMSSLPTTEPKTLGVRSRIKNYLNLHRIVKDAMMVSSFLVGCIISAYVLVTYVGISKDYAFGGAVAVFVGLLTVYYLRPKP